MRRINGSAYRLNLRGRIGDPQVPHETWSIITLDYEGLSLLLNLKVPAPDAGERIPGQKPELITSDARPYRQPVYVNGAPRGNRAIFSRLKYPVKGNSHKHVLRQAQENRVNGL